jgi:predicted dehydrogenase
VIEAATKKRKLVRVGFNHRYHPGLRKARELVDAGAIGPLMFVRGRYGHGGRVGYEQEWRANPELSGGGELIDQGVHLIDLSRWFLGDFAHISGFAHTYFWKMAVDDNAFVLLRTPTNTAAFLHVSCTEWKNLFSFEIYGTTGKLQIDGLGGSYGVERITWYRMLPEMGPPETSAWEFPRGDDSWTLEFSEFLDDIHLDRSPAAGLADARAALAVVEHVHRLSGYDFARPKDRAR